MGKSGNNVRFRGRFDVKVDNRGRMRISSRFLNIFENGYGNDIYITSLNGDHALIYPMLEWENIEHKLENVKMNPLIQEYISRTSFWGIETEVDARGRVLLPKNLRTTAKLNEAIFILGARDHLEVWNSEFYNKRFLKGEWNMEKQAEISRIINENK